MGRGLISGLIWGTFLGGLGLIVLSLWTPVPADRVSDATEAAGPQGRAVQGGGAGGETPGTQGTSGTPTPATDAPTTETPTTETPASDDRSQNGQVPETSASTAPADAAAAAAPVVAEAPEAVVPPEAAGAAPQPATDSAADSAVIPVEAQPAPGAAAPEAPPAAASTTPPGMPDAEPSAAGDGPARLAEAVLPPVLRGGENGDAGPPPSPLPSVLPGRPSTAMPEAAPGTASESAPEPAPEPALASVPELGGVSQETESQVEAGGTTGTTPRPRVLEMPGSGTRNGDGTGIGGGPEVVTLPGTVGTGVGEAGFASRDTGVRTGRLPRIGAAPASGPLTETGDGAAVPGRDGATAGTSAGGALERYAAAFDNASAKPLMSIILFDLGPGVGGVERDALRQVPFPVTIAISADRSDATEAARAFREDGNEIALVAGALPPSATPTDIEIAFEVFHAAVPEAIAVLDAPEGGFQASRALAAQVVAIAGAEGQGVLTYDRGLNSAEQVARRDGVPAAQVFRDLDPAPQDADSIRRALDRAALRAVQQGSVVVLARSRPETLQAILAWALEGRADSVALAPVSAVLGEGY